MDVKSNVEELNKMILEGQIMEAFEKFYAEDVVMIEPGEEPHMGKDVNRQREEKFMSMIKQFHGGEVKAVAVEGDKAFVEWMMDVEFQDGNRVKMEQVAVQTWRDGKIVEERFYYDKPKQ